MTAMRNWAMFAALAACWASGLAAGSVDRSVRPEARPASGPAELVATTPERTMAARGPEADLGFNIWVASFKRRAEGLGLDPRLLDRAFDGVRFDADVIRRDRTQLEFTKTVWDYLDTAVSDARIRAGKAVMARHADTLAEIEDRYGVDARIVAAIWGLESAYGAVRGSQGVIRSLATLAHDSRRGAFFESQLVAALSILQRREAGLPDMRGSWAGAMGHTQFMPTSYLLYAVDHDGDGRRDIWGDDPADALASTAAYLARFGWTRGQPWGVEVTLPEGFDYLLADRRIEKSPADWAELGVLGTDGRPVPDHGPGSILLPGGHRGAAFMIFPNFAVLERYNTADAYVIGVGHLGDRIMGGEPIRHGWPREDRALTLDERLDLQRRLHALGFDPQGIDGRIGPLTVDAVRAYQSARGLVPDGYPSPSLLARLR
ncbi:MAG: lytic murein transglycosylase [Jhaorihella sp.]